MCPSTGEYYYDAEHCVKMGSKGVFVPTLISHGHLVMGHSQTIAGGLQHLAAMGVSVFRMQREGCQFPHIGCDFEELVRLKELSEQECKNLAGNALHEPTLGAIVMFMLCSVRTVDDDKHMETDYNFEMNLGDFKIEGEDTGVDMGVHTAFDTVGAADTDDDDLEGTTLANSPFKENIAVDDEGTTVEVGGTATPEALGETACPKDCGVDPARNNGSD